MPGAILSLSANGSSDAIVWATVPNRDALNEISAGRLIAFDAATLAELWRDDDEIAYAKYTPPTIADGKVFRPTFGGEIVVYGLLHGRAPQVPCNDAAETFRVYGGAEALGDPIAPASGGEIDYLVTRYSFDDQQQLRGDSRASAIFYSPATCGHVVRDEILAAYRGKESLLGLPITNDEATSTERLRIEIGGGWENTDMRQRFTHFEHGSIFFTPRTGAHEIHGPIRDEWARLNWDRGLGFPSTDVIGSRAGLVQHSEFHKFQFEWDAPAESAIYWSAATGAHAIYGDIYKYWKEHSDIGLPLDDEHDGISPDGRPARVSDFQNGRIYWIKGVNPAETFDVR
jgi:hypothetical protein